MTRLHAVDYDAGKALFEVGDRFVVVDINKRDVSEVTDTRESLTASAWLKVSPMMEHPKVWSELAEAAVTTLELEENESPRTERKFRVPEVVKQEALQAINWVKGFERGNSVVGVAIATKLIESTYVTATDIARIYRYFKNIGDVSDFDAWSPGQNGFPSDERIRYALRGGSYAAEWVEKIAKKHPLTAAGEPDLDMNGDELHEYIDDPDIPGYCLICGREEDADEHIIPDSPEFEPSEETDYFGKGDDPDSTYVTELYERRADGTWGMYDGTSFVDIQEPAEDAVIIMLDDDSVKTLANFIENRDPDTQDRGIELSMLNPHEAALFALADAEIDWEMVDRVFDIYDSQERSVNAKKQNRAPGGRFGENPDNPQDSEKPAQKARLPRAMPLVPDVAARIQQFIQESGGGAPAAQIPAADAPISEASTISLLNSLIHGPKVLGATQFVEGAEAPTPTAAVQPLYLAIVDSVDTEAVLDVVSLMPGNPPVMWKRDAGQWVQAPEILQQLQGTTPPPVVELTDNAVVADVLNQVDQATGEQGDDEDATPPGQTEQRPDGSTGPKPDANPDQHPVPTTAAAFAHPELDMFGENISEKHRKKYADKGYALPDGSFPIPDVAHLKKAVKAFGRAKNKAAAKRHIMKRARALNRVDLIPNDWDKSNSTQEYSLYGPNGEIMTLFAEGGLDKNRGGAEKLRRYWTKGEGAAKIRWNTPGDWTRCYKHLRKYLGVRAKGYCTLRHREATGRWPGERDENGNL